MIELPLHDNKQGDNKNEEQNFGEFRKKIRAAEMLSASMQKLIQAVHFTGRLCVIVQNGKILKSGYEEGYFRQPETGITPRLQ